MEPMVRSFVSQFIAILDTMEAGVLKFFRDMVSAIESIDFTPHDYHPPQYRDFTKGQVNSVDDQVVISWSRQQVYWL